MSILTGLTSGIFDSLRVKNPSSGQYESVFPGGGGATDTDLSAYATTTHVLALIASSLSPYATSAQANLSIASSVSTALLAYATTAEADAAVAQALQAYVTSVSLNAQLGSYALTSAMNAALAGKLDTLTGSGCTISGTGESRTITVATDLSAYATTASLETYAALNYVKANFLSPTNPLSFTVGSGLNANLTANSISLSLTHSEVRPRVSLVDTNNAVKELTSSGANLLFDNQQLAKSSELLSVAVAGTSYPVTGMNFTNHFHLFDSASQTLNIGPYLYCLL